MNRAPTGNHRTGRGAIRRTRLTRGPTVTLAEQTRTGLDPITLEIIHGTLESAIREMEALVDRTAMSAMIKEKKDRFVGMYDATGRMVAAHRSFSGPGLIEPLLAQYPPAVMEPGDLYWYNDPY